MRRQVMAATAVALVGLGVAGSAGAEPLVFEHRFTTDRPGAPTGMTSHIVYPDYNGKPKPIARLVLELPAGTRFDEGVVPVCTASDQDLFAQGLGACPPPTRMGGGTGRVVTGFGPPIDPISGDVHFVHGPHQVVNVATPPGGEQVLLVSRGRIEGERLVYTPPSDSPPASPGGPPDGRTSGKEVTLRLEPRASGDRGFLTTPSTCSAGGGWTFRLSVTYEDGTGDAATSTSPCRAGQTAAGPGVLPGLRLTVRPRRVRAGSLTRLRIRVESDAAACTRGASIRFGRAHTRTDGRGRALLIRRPRPPSRRTVRASKPGCRPARAVVAIVR